MEDTEFTAAAAAKSLQSCPTLCDPIDSSPPGSPIPGILQARTLGWVAISFSDAWKWKVKVKSLSRVWLLAFQTPPSMGFSRQEYWSGVPLPFKLTRDDLSMLIYQTEQREINVQFSRFKSQRRKAWWKGQDHDGNKNKRKKKEVALLRKQQWQKLENRKQRGKNSYFQNIHTPEYPALGTQYNLLCFIHV